MAIKNPIQFVSRTFNTILNDINSDSELVDKPNWFKRIWAGVGDVISMWINALGNNLVLRTSYTRQNTADILELIDYHMNPQSTSSGNMIFYISSTASFPFSVSVANLKAQNVGSLNVSSKVFEARSGITVTEVIESFGVSDVNISTDNITVGRVFTTGEKVIFTGATLPSPIIAGTEYWIIKTSDTTVRISTSLSNAYAGIYINITTVGASTMSMALYSAITTCYQQELQSTRSIGESDGVTEFQDFSLVEQNIIEDTIVITVNGETYSKQDTLVFSDDTDKHYEIVYTTDNVAIARFGNGIYGIIPPAFDIEATFATGGGVDSNIGSANNVNIYTGSDSNIVGVSNPDLLSGGSDVEDTESAKRLGPLLLKTRDRFITDDDGEALAENYGGVSQVKVNGNVYGVLSAQVIIVPDGGGTTSTAFKDGLDVYLTDRTVLESIDVRVFDAIYLTQNVVSGTKVLDGYNYTDILPYIEIAWRLIFSETGFEIVEDYESNGIASATTLINTIFGTSFSVSDYDQIQTLIENLPPRFIGSDIYQSDVLGYIDSNVLGVDYITVSSPSFPVLVDVDECTTDGTITISEII